MVARKIVSAVVAAIIAASFCSHLFIINAKAISYSDEEETGTMFYNGPHTAKSDGWIEILNEIFKSPEKSTFAIEMNNQRVVPKDLFVAADDMRTTVILKYGDYSWTVDGESYQKLMKYHDVDLSIDKASVPDELIKSLGGLTYMFRIKYDGDLYFTGKLKYLVGKQHAGKSAKMYYYDEKKNELVYKGIFNIDSDGYISVDMKHCSTYVLNVSKPSSSEYAAGEGINSSEYLLV